MFVMCEGNRTTTSVPTTPSTNHENFDLYHSLKPDFKYYESDQFHKIRASLRLNDEVQFKFCANSIANSSGVNDSLHRPRPFPLANDHKIWQDWWRDVISPDYWVSPADVFFKIRRNFCDFLYLPHSKPSIIAQFSLSSCGFDGYLQFSLSIY